MNTLIAPTNPPSLRSLLDAFKIEVSKSLNCHQLGTLVSWDPTTQVASVQLSSLATLPDGSQVPYPVLTDCPVFTLGSGKDRFISVPLRAGDPCLVLFHDTDMDNWFTTGNVTAPNSRRTHSLSDGLVLAGFRSLATRTDISDSSEIVIYYMGSRVIVGEAPVIQSVSGAFVQVGSKINAQNGSGRLGDALRNLCDVLTAWVNTGGSTPNSATLAAITAVKTAIDNLMV